jgi:flagella basal body P-ring formation protein FlgA
MNQASNSLLTFYPIPFKAKPRIPEFLRDEARVGGRLFTPFRICQKMSLKISFSFLLELFCLLRSFVRVRLGEGRIRSLLSAICLILFAASLHPVEGRAAGPVIIKLKEQVSITSDKVVLKEIADLQGADAVHLEKLAMIQLCNAPPFGITLTLSQHQVSELIQKTAGSIPEMSISGAAIVQIILRGRKIASEEIEPPLKAYLAATTCWKESEIEIRSIENLEGVEAPPGEIQLQVSSRKDVMGHGRILFPVEILQGGQVLRSFWPTAEVRIHAEIVKASRSIHPGVAISPEDTVLLPAENADLHADYLRSPEEILGKISNRNFAAGEPLMRRAFVNPFLVKHGETVLLRLERNGILLTAPGQAEQDGRLGQTINVRSREFSTLLKAQVTGPAEVKIQ